MKALPSSGPSPWILAAVGGFTILIATIVRVGADTMWMVALGDDIVAQRAIPLGMPFGGTVTQSWVNVPVLGEIVFSRLNALGSWGLFAGHIAVVAVMLSVVAGDANRSGSDPRAVAAALMLLVLGALPTLGIVRAQSLSLVMFALLAALLREDHRRPSHRAWWLVALIAVWGNLHGAVLTGVALVGCYLLFSRARRRPFESAALLVACVASLWLTPGGLRTHEYYLGVLTNASAGQRVGLWAPISLDSGFDLLLLLTGSALVGLFLVRRRAVWEYVTLAGLLVMTAMSARHGIWLLTFAAPGAALAMSRPRRKARESNMPSLVVVSVAVIVAVAAAVAVAPKSAGKAQQDLVAARVASQITPMATAVAPSPLAEELAQHGVTLWAANPIDAFPQDRQTAYLKFLERGAMAVSGMSPRPETVVLTDSDDPSALPEGYVRTWSGDGFVVFRWQLAASDN